MKITLHKNKIYFVLITRSEDGIHLSGGSQYILGLRYASLIANSQIGVFDKIEGKITQVVQNSISGWACTQGITKPIKVHLYLNGLYGSGTFITEAQANLVSNNAEIWNSREYFA